MPLAEELDVVEALVALAVLAAVEAEIALPVAIEIQHVIDEQHPHRFTDRNVQDVLLDDLAVLERQARDRLAALAAEPQPPLGVLGHVDPRAVLGAIGPQHMLDLEAREHVQDGGRVLGDIAGIPRRGTVRRTIDGLDHDQRLAGGCSDVDQPVLGRFARERIGADAVFHAQLLRHPRRGIAELLIAGGDREVAVLDLGGDRCRHVRRVLRVRRERDRGEAGQGPGDEPGLQTGTGSAEEWSRRHGHLGRRCVAAVGRRWRRGTGGASALEARGESIPVHWSAVGSPGRDGCCVRGSVQIGASARSHPADCLARVLPRRPLPP